MNKNLVKVFIKKSEELSSTELQEMSAIAKNLIPGLLDNHIQKNHIEKNAPEFSLLKVNNEVVAFQSFNLFYTNIPTYKKQIPVIYSGLMYKKKGMNLNSVYKKLSGAYLKHQLGFFWYLKPFSFTTTTVNPRMTYELSKRFKYFYPKPEIPVDEKTIHFIHQFYDEFIHKKVSTNEFLVNTESLGQIEKSEITQDWSKMYESRSEIINQFFIKQGIFEKTEGKLYLTAQKNLVVLMIYIPFKQLFGRK